MVTENMSYLAPPSWRYVTNDELDKLLEYVKEKNVVSD
jgi:hypothetical protein